MMPFKTPTIKKPNKSVLFKKFCLMTEYKKGFILKGDVNSMTKIIQGDLK